MQDKPAAQTAGKWRQHQRSRQSSTTKRLQKSERLFPNLMNSRRPIRSDLLAPLHLTSLGMAAFSLTNSFAYCNKIPDAGPVAGIFLTGAVAAGWLALSTMAEVLHRRGDAAVQLVPNSLAQTAVRLCR